MSGNNVEPNGLDSRYITGVSLNQYFVNKSNGAPLAGGQLFFFQDSQRNIAKPVYELVQGSGSPPQYSYVPLPNPVTLSAVGTITDNNNNNVALYYYPFDENGDEELYYVECYAAGAFDLGGAPQFTREAWPFPNIEEGEAEIAALGIVSNQITNPTFTQVLFNTSTLTLSFSGTGNATVPIAPGWELYVAYTGTTTVTVTQNPRVGSTNLLNNPPYTLDITPGANISNIYLQQKLFNNPDWAASNVYEPAATGWVSGSILIGPGTEVIMQYAASSGNTTPQVIVTDTNTNTGEYEYIQVNGTIQLKTANSSATGAVGYDLIQIVLQTDGPSSISNVQLISLNEDISDVAYEQTTSNRQLSLMFDYYKFGLDFKPTASYLVGWDFASAPFQPLGNTGGPFTIGSPNKAVYINDTTIVFQTVDASFGFSQSDSGALFLTAQSANTQWALVQYVPADICDAALNNLLCSMVQSFSNNPTALTGTVSIWACTNDSLPSAVVSNATFFTGLNSSGYPTGAISGWTEISRFYSGSVGLGQFTIGSTLANAPLAGFQDFTGIGDSAYFLAIVVGISEITAHYSWNIQSISLQPGVVPTLPAPEADAITLLKCQQFFRTSFPPGTVPANGAGAAGAVCYSAQSSALGAVYTVYVPFSPALNSVPTTTGGNPQLQFYNPVQASGNNGKWYNIGASQPSGVASAPNTLGKSGMGIRNAQVSDDVANNLMAVHYAIDVRLGY